MNAESRYPFDASNDNQSAQVIQIDSGKHVTAVAVCAAICGLCMAVTVGTVWHSNAREVETQARLRVLQNHIDDTANKVVVMQELQEKRK